MFKKCKFIRIVTVMSILFCADYFYIAFVNTKKLSTNACFLSSNFEYHLGMLLTLAFMLGAFFAFLISYYSADSMRRELTKYIDDNKTILNDAKENTDKIDFLIERMKILERDLHNVFSQKIK